MTHTAKISNSRVLSPAFVFVAFLPCLLSIYFLMQPVLVSAEPQGSETTGGADTTGGTNPGPSASLLNPLEADDLLEFLEDVIDVLLLFALPIIIFFIMYGGFKLVTARGESEKISEGRAAITWAVIGGVIVLGAKTIIEVIQGTVDSL